MHDPQKTISAGSKLQGHPKSIKRPCTLQTRPLRSISSSVRPTGPLCHSFSPIPAAHLFTHFLFNRCSQCECYFISTLSRQHCQLLHKHISSSISPFIQVQPHSHSPSNILVQPHIRPLHNHISSATESTPDTFDRVNHLRSEIEEKTTEYLSFEIAPACSH